MKLHLIPFLPYLFTLSTAQQLQDPTVTLKDATYIGTAEKIATSPTETITVNKFLSLRFAAPPQRFRAPKLPAPGNTTIEATKQPPSCTDAEDCLFLNIFAPAPAPAPQGQQRSSPGKKGKAVLLWLHGGALQSGSISGFDGSLLAANEDLVVVTSQYRLGITGFPGNVSGIPPDELNPGFRDQKLALKWIQDNIELFGGDKERVTIAGESAGAVSVDAQLLSEPFEKPLFHAAILQSGGLHTFTRVALGIGPYVTGLGTGNLASETPFMTLARALGCSLTENTLGCVQSRSFFEVKDAVRRVNLLFPPVDDAGLSSVGDSDTARRRGRTARVPVLIGSTFDEGTVFPRAGIESKSLEEWVEIIYPGTGPGRKELRESVLKAYGVGTSWQVRSEAEARHLLHSDFHFACTTTYDANLVSGLGIRKFSHFNNPVCFLI